MCTKDLSDNELSDEQAAFVGRELQRHLRAGANISGTHDCLRPESDAVLIGSLLIKYPAPMMEQKTLEQKASDYIETFMERVAEIENES